jgi:hypothetical protein
MLMKAKGYKGVYTLLGGLEEWKQTILFPSLPPFHSPKDSLAFEKKKEISKYFGGSPQSGSVQRKLNLLCLFQKFRLLPEYLYKVQ